MKNKKIINVFFAIMFGMVGCAEFDHENKEFYKQEVYIINSESTSAVEREITGIDAYTFVDTQRIINDDYDVETIINKKDGLVSVIFKVGLGGSLPAKEDLNIVVAFNQEAVEDYNTGKNTECYIPDASFYTTNIPYDTEKKGFPVIIKKGGSSTELRFDIPIKRDNISSYEDYIFPLKITDVGSAVLSRQYSDFIVARLDVYTQITVDWGGMPIPKIPAGRYESSLAKATTNENMVKGVHRIHKFITPLAAPGDDNPELANRYMIWGHGTWSWECLGFSGVDNDWMYNPLTLNDQVAGTYTLENLTNDDLDFPAKTFHWESVSEVTTNNKYDPKKKQLTVYYKNIIHKDYIDVLTYIDDNWELNPNGTDNNRAPKSWEEIRNKGRGYKYWLPIDEE